MKNSLALSTAVDGSTFNHHNSYVDVRVRLPASRIDIPLLFFHLLPITLFTESHSGQSLYGFIVFFLSSLCTDWARRLIVSSTVEAPNMTGAMQFFSTRPGNTVVQLGLLYRIWRLVHQLDIVMNGAFLSMQNLSIFSL